MGAEEYKKAIDYELLTKSIYEQILARDGVENFEVLHDQSVQGRSGVAHQIDVSWKFKIAGVVHYVLIECKNYKSSLTLEKVRNFFAVLHDIGSCSGIMVTKTGYQSGASDFAKFYGINLKLLRKPTKEDWEGVIKKINISLKEKVPVSTEECPIQGQMCIRPSSDEQEVRLNAVAAENPELLQATPDTVLVDKWQNPITPTLAWWIPQQLNTLEYEDGGPYEQKLPLQDHYILLNLGKGKERCEVIGFLFKFWVTTLNIEQYQYDAVSIVEAVLSDFHSGRWEHVSDDS